MTTERRREIGEMSGRELDKAVAVCLGVKAHEYSDFDNSTFWGLCGKGRRFPAKSGNTEAEAWLNGSPAYTTDATAFKDVKVAIQVRGWHWRVAYMGDDFITFGRTQKHFQARCVDPKASEVGTNEYELLWAFWYADTEETALCRAFVAACEATK